MLVAAASARALVPSAALQASGCQAATAAKSDSQGACDATAHDPNSSGFTPLPL